MPLAGLWLRGYIRRPWGPVWMKPFGMHHHDAGCFVHTIPLFRFMRWYAFQACLCHPLAYMLTHMSMHESYLLVCCPCFNTMKLWTFDPNLHLSLVDTIFCMPSFLFACFLVCLPTSSLAYLVACHVSCHILCLLRLYVCLLYTHCALSMHLFLSIACLLVSCLCLCMYSHGARTLAIRAQSLRYKQKGWGCEHVDKSQAAMFNRFRGLASPIWLCTLLNHLPSFLLSLLDELY